MFYVICMVSYSNLTVYYIFQGGYAVFYVICMVLYSNLTVYYIFQGGFDVFYVICMVLCSNLTVYFIFQGGYSFYTSLAGASSNVNIGTAEMTGNVKGHPHVPMAAIQSIASLHYNQTKVNDGGSA